MKNFINCLAGILILTIIGCDSTDVKKDTNAIRLNQIGYYPSGEKIAVAQTTASDSFYIRNRTTNEIVFRGKSSAPRTSPLSDKQYTVMEFTSLETPGAYVIELGNTGQSYPFEIKGELLRPLAEASIRAFYYQRTGMPVEEKYAGKWHRPSAHPDTLVMVHANAASDKRPEGYILSSPKGWYDAGDYNKYIVNSAFTIGLMQALAEDVPEYIQTLNLNIPESNNSTPDLLDEIHYNLDWMFTMQDPADGGVYHKLTTPNFEGFIKPIECKQQRYVVRKSVTAALDFAASMAQAARLFKPYETDYPGFPEKATKAAQQAYKWALENPDAYYEQEKLNEQYQPAVMTGTYGDKNAKDEFFWAAVELYTTTGNESYQKDAFKYQPETFTVPTWGNVSGLGFLTILRNADKWEVSGRNYPFEILNLLTDYCDRVIAGVDNMPFVTPYGNKPGDFGWGCISEGCANQSMALLKAYTITGNEKYWVNALRNADYMLGRNATGYCYVTGFGTHSPMHPHHRLAASDDIVEPLPGFLVGGPNPSQQDKSATLVYPTDIPDESYVDEEASYASNEIAINWNGSLVYVSGMIDAIFKMK